MKAMLRAPAFGAVIVLLTSCAADERAADERAVDERGGPVAAGAMQAGASGGANANARTSDGPERSNGASSAPRATAGHVEAGRILIAPVFKPGHVDYCEFKQDVTQVQSDAVGPAVTTGLKRLYGMMRRVESADDRQIRVSLTIDRAAHEKWSPHLRRWHDTDRMDNPLDLEVLAVVLDLIKNRKMEFTLDAARRVTGVEGAQSISDALSELKETLFAPEVMRDLSPPRLAITWFYAPMALYANRAVAVGDVWKSSVDDEWPVVGPIRLNFECRLDKLEGEPGRRTATVSFRGALEPVGDLSAMDRFARSYQSDWDGAATFSEERGEFTRRAQQTRTTWLFAGRAPRPDQPAADQRMRLTVDQVMRVLTPAEREAEKKNTAERSRPKSSLPVGGDSRSPTAGPSGG